MDLKDISIMSLKASEYIPPVPCPKCGERQNRFNSHIKPKSTEVNRIDCMVCGRIFDSQEYADLLSAVNSFNA